MILSILIILIDRSTCVRGRILIVQNESFYKYFTFSFSTTHIHPSSSSSSSSKRRTEMYYSSKRQPNKHFLPIFLLALFAALLRQIDAYRYYGMLNAYFMKRVKNMTDLFSKTQEGTRGRQSSSRARSSSLDAVDGEGNYSKKMPRSLPRARSARQC